MQDAYVLLSTGKDKRFGSWRNQQVSRIIRMFTRSDFCHCAIAFDGIVLDPSLTGVNYYPLDKVIRYYPTLSHIFRVKLKYAIDLDYFAHLHSVPQPIMPRVWRTIDLGRGEWVYDCICIVLACLHAGGAGVSHTILSPQGLYKWLLEERYRYARISETDTPAERCDRVAELIEGRTCQQSS